MGASITDDEQAGAVEPFSDAALYDWEYRRRRQDVAFYRMLADERGGPILDLGCGTGRITIPLARDGHTICGVDLSPQMLARAASRRRRLARPRAERCLLLRGDLRALPVRGHFPLILAAFHTVQHLVADRDLERLFRRIRTLIAPDGWFAFDVFFPNPRWLARQEDREFDRTLFTHPTTGQHLAYTISHRLDTARKALHMRLRYQPVDGSGAGSDSGRVVRLCHRQLPPADVEGLLRGAGMRILRRWGGFMDEPFPTEDELARGTSPTEQHVYLAGPA